MNDSKADMLILTLDDIVQEIQTQTKLLKELMVTIKSTHSEMLCAQQIRVKVIWPDFDPDKDYRCVFTYVERAIAYADSDIIYLVLDDDGNQHTIPGHTLKPYSEEVIPLVRIV